MPIPYQVLGEFTGSVQSGSFLDVQDTGLFYASQSSDIWFGFSANDEIELGVYDTSTKDLLNWGTLNQSKEFQTITLSYTDNLNNILSYSYRELLKPFTLFKNNVILLQPASDLATVGVNDGSFIVSYNFIRQMAGSPSSSLVIKEISPSRTELKLIPSGQPDVAYNSFYLKKFPIRDVAPVLLSIAKGIQFDSIYAQMSENPKYADGISFLKFVFFLPDDGSVVQFLKNLYEDFIKFSAVPSSTGAPNDATTLTRIQGIKTYYNNYLLQNYESAAGFDDIETQFISFVNLRLDEQFRQLINVKNQGAIDARQFCYDFFVVFFYDASVNPLKASYNDKYFGYFKNVLNFGNNEYFPILTHTFLDERQSPTDPVTLIIKLSSALPSDISTKDACWISNFGMTPYIFTTILQNPVTFQTIKISGPNFGSPQNLINKETSNTLFSSDDLNNSPSVDDSIRVNKSLAELNTDYSDFSHFVVFSSIATRLNIFKSKMIQWTTLSASLSVLNDRYNASLSSSNPYPYFFTEQMTLTNRVSDLVKSFDGYESFLFNQGSYQFNIPSNSFVSSSYVADQDFAAQEYDTNNRDSLMAGTPQYISTDANYSDYLTFLNMIGHHFDNIYTYISAMPIERQVRNQLTSSIPTKTLKEMLYSFGWNVDDIIGSLNIDEVYLNSMDSSSFNSLSGQQRLQTIWNRILVSLPGIYKTKGTQECVNFLMSCYGLPSSMITVREYGGTDSADETTPTYQLDEKTYMLNFSGVGDFIEGPIPFSVSTVELKFSIAPDDNKTYYPDYKFFPLITSIPYPNTASSQFNWMLGFYRVPGQFTGKLVFQMGSGSTGASITSSVLPIFNGEIFSTMLRRNLPDALFETSADPSVVPLKYDLYVQRSENGRNIFYSTSSNIFYQQDNDIFAQFGRFRLSNGAFKGTLDKLNIWDIPLDDNDFQEHVDDLNSYGYSGSVAFQNLWVRLNWDYPQDMFYELSGSSVVWVDNRSAYYAIPNFYTNQNLNVVDPELYSASIDITQERWQAFYPTGSVQIRAFNFPEAVGSAFSASFIGPPTCEIFSQSVYPFHFEELTYQQDIDASKYGPNKYKNKKIRTLIYDVDARFDPKDRSTSEPNQTVSGESNQLGFFIDPQDSKNKDIIRYVGKNGIMELIGNPSNIFSDKYYDLRNKNYQYNTHGNKKTYFNELLTIYKFYFDKSIFQAIKNVLPARANAYTGVVIEPTILERPKYQNKPVTSSVDISYQHPGVIRNIYTFTETLLWANFNTDFTLVNSGSPQLQQAMANSMPPNYEMKFNFRYLADPIRIRPQNLTLGYITDMPDRVQHNFYPDFQDYVRGWETSSIGTPLASNLTVPILGSVSAMNENGRFMIGSDHGVNYANKFFSGFNHGNHPIIYYMLKTWEKHYYFAKTGQYVRSDNPLADTYSSASVYLYKYIIVDEYYMRNLIYFTDLAALSVYDTSSYSYTYNAGIDSYLHKANTFLGTPDQMVSNISASANSLTPLAKTIFDLNLNPASNQYFEVVSGYPRNHYNHKLDTFSKTKFGMYNQVIFVKGRQTSNSTINTNGINDGSFPVQSFGTSDMNVVNSSNVVQNVPSAASGQVTPTGGSSLPSIIAN